MYVKQEVPITRKASQITGLIFYGSSMFYHGKPVVCHSLHHALESFGRSLALFEDPVLFAHNCRKFDSLIVCSAMQNVSNVKLHEKFRGFCDALEFFRAILPFSKRCFLHIWLYLFWKFHIMVIMLWRIPKFYKEPPNYFSMRLRNISWIIRLILLELLKLYLFNLRSNITLKLWNHCVVQNVISK